MYRLVAVESIEAAQSLRSPEADTPVPPPVTWLDPSHIGLMAVDETGPVGGILLIPCRQVMNHVTKYRMEWLYVHRPHRGRGLGRQLASAAAAEANRRGASAIQISVHPDNNEGLSWSESLPKVAGLGFVVSLDRGGM